jgi:hypothetical protein
MLAIFGARPPRFSIADCFEQLRGSEGLLQERGVDRYRLHGLAGHNDDVHIRVLAAGILSKFDPGHRARQVVVGDQCLQFPPQSMR